MERRSSPGCDFEWGQRRSSADAWRSARRHGDHDLAAVGGVLRELLLLITAMDGLSEPEPLIAAAAGEAEAAQERRFEEIGYGEVELQALGVETRRHRGEVYASVPPWSPLIPCFQASFSPVNAGQPLSRFTTRPSRGLALEAHTP